MMTNKYIFYAFLIHYKFLNFWSTIINRKKIPPKKKVISIKNFVIITLTWRVMKSTRVVILFVGCLENTLSLHFFSLFL